MAARFVINWNSDFNRVILIKEKKKLPLMENNEVGEFFFESYRGYNHSSN